MPFVDHDGTFEHAPECSAMQVLHDKDSLAEKHSLKIELKVPGIKCEQIELSTYKLIYNSLCLTVCARQFNVKLSHSLIF